MWSLSFRQHAPLRVVGISSRRGRTRSGMQKYVHMRPSFTLNQRGPRLKRKIASTDSANVTLNQNSLPIIIKLKELHPVTSIYLIVGCRCKAFLNCHARRHSIVALSWQLDKLVPSCHTAAGGQNLITTVITLTFIRAPHGARAYPWILSKYFPSVSPCVRASVRPSVRPSPYR